jgi:transcription antitermination factor NusG
MTALYSIGDFVDFVERPTASPLKAAVWYLLRLHPNYDLKAEKQLQDRGISVYVPKEKQTIKTGWNRRVSRDVPIFPGAMFVPDFEADVARLKRFASGIGGFVKCDGQCLRVSLDRMDEIRRFEEKQNGVPEKRKYKLGQNVVVTDGPWKLWEGRIERLDRNYRLRVLIDALTREIPIDLSEDQVQAV